MSSYDDGSGSPGEATIGREPSASATYAPQPGMSAHAPMQQPRSMYGYGQWEMRPRRVYPIETKPFFLTSEFFGAVAVIAGIAITAASSDAFGAWRAWLLITAITVAYLVSRGIAKSGTRSHADDPREHLDLDWGGDRSGRHGRMQARDGA